MTHQQGQSRSSAIDKLYSDVVIYPNCHQDIVGAIVLMVKAVSVRMAQQCSSSSTKGWCLSCATKSFKCRASSTPVRAKLLGGDMGTHFWSSCHPFGRQQYDETRTSRTTMSCAIAVSKSDVPCRLCDNGGVGTGFRAYPTLRGHIMWIWKRGSMYVRYYMNMKKDYISTYACMLSKRKESFSTASN